MLPHDNSFRYTERSLLVYRGPGTAATWIDVYKEHQRAQLHAGSVSAMIRGGSMYGIQYLYLEIFLVTA